MNIPEAYIDEPKPKNFDRDLNTLYKDCRISKTAKSRIWDKYMYQSVRRIQENPYQLIYDIRGVGFTIADKIARNAGIDMTSWKRIRAAIYHSLRQMAPVHGHSCVPENFLINLVRKLIDVDVDLIVNEVHLMLDDSQLISYREMLYLPYMYDDEVLISHKLMSLMNAPVSLKINGENINTLLMQDQVSAMEKINSGNVFILTGAPGTGKTYTITHIINSFPRDTVIRIAAPTGKAAKRMIEQTGYPASTVHKLLEPTMDDDGKFIFTRNEDNPIETDVLILDEVSMMSVPLMACLMKALPEDAKLIMVGDTYQLPPVGAGYVLRDMIQSNVIPYKELTIIKRQDPGLIIENCHAIKNGAQITINNDHGDFVLLHNNNEHDIQRVIVKTLTETLPQKYLDLDILRDVQVLSPMREKTPLSCLPLNKLLQDTLNHENKPLHQTEFRVGDKVINTKNNYREKIINGDIGYVQNINTVRMEIVVDFESPNRMVKLPLWDNNIQLAYAITCHKFQGSETRVIIIPIHSCFAPIIMQRNWLYTAVSRARELCIIIGQTQEIPKIIARNKQIMRYTSLTEFLQEG